MANPFDQFDAPQENVQGGNAFDQFDSDPFTQTLDRDQVYEENPQALIPTGDEEPSMRVAKLPDPTQSDIYAGIENPEDRSAVYGAYAQHPNTQQDEEGNLIYNGKPVPRPDFDAPDPSTLGVRMIGGLGKGVINAGAEMGRLAASTGDLALGAVGQKPFLTEKYDEINPGRYSDEDLFVQFAIDTGEYIPGMIAGDRGAKKLVGEAAVGASKTKRLGKFLPRYLAAEAGGAAGTTADEDDYIVVQHAINNIPALQGMGINPEDPRHVNNIKNKLNMAADGMLVGAVLGGIARAGGGAIKYVFGVVDKARGSEWRNLSAHQKRFVNDVVSIYADLPENPSREQLQRAWTRTSAVLNERKDVLASFGEPDVEDIAFQSDTITTLINSLDPKTEGRTIKELEELRAAALTGGSPRLETALEKPRMQVDESMDQLFEAKGGREGVERAQESVVGSGVEEVGVLREGVRQTTGDIARVEQEIRTSMAENPEFGAILDRLGDKVNLDFESPNLASRGRIIEQLDEASRIMTQRKNELFEAIPEGIPVDTNALNVELEKVQQFLPEDVVAKLGEASNDFKKLYDFSNLTLDGEISAALKANDIEKLRALRDFRRHIHDYQLNAVANTPAGEAARAARDYYRNEYAPFWRDGPLQDLQDVTRDTVNQPVRREQQAGPIVERTLEDPRQPKASGQMTEALARPEAGGDAQSALDYAITSIAKPVQKIINKKGALNEQDYAILADEVAKFTPVLDKLSPGSRQSIEGFLTKIRNKTIQKDELTELLKLKETQLKEGKETIFGSDLGEFFTKRGDEYVAKPGAQDNFKKLFSKAENADKLDGIIKRIEDDPEARKGMQAAWTKMAHETLTGNKDVGTLNDTFKDFGSKVYEDNPEVVNIIDFLSGKARGAEGANLARKGQGFDMTQFQREYSTSQNNVITWIWGVLNPKAARIRTITGEFAKRYDSKDIAKIAADTILSDPALFERIVRENNVGVISPELKRDIFKSMVRAGVYSDADEEKFFEAEETEDALGKTEE